VANDILKNVKKSGLGVLLGGIDESHEERFVDRGNLRAEMSKLFPVASKGNKISNNSDRVDLSGIQIFEGLVDISKEGNIDAFIDVGDVVKFEVVVETFKELAGRGGGVTLLGKEPVVSDSGGGNGNKDGKKEELVHLG